MHVLEGHSNSSTHFALLPGDRAISASDDHTLRLWDLASGRLIGSMVGDSPASCIAISSHGDSGICGHRDGRITFFKWGTVKLASENL